MFEHIRIVLVGTSHPGNIGAAARAMKTMGLSRLYLVSPKHFPHVDAQAMASGADDILDNTVTTQTLDEALAGCHFVIGTSARSRWLAVPLLDGRECGVKAVENAEKGHQVAVVFGREQSGLNNEELERCHFHVCIPSDPQFSSLNVAAAVQLICYEIRVAWQCNQSQLTSTTETNVLATADEVEGFYQHLEELLTQIEFFKSSNLKSLMRKIRRLYRRVNVEKMEVNILRGILTAIQKKLALQHEAHE